MQAAINVEPFSGSRRTPRVSIGMPIYNSEHYVATAIESILQQSFADFELIICDNASTDRSRDICQSYVARDARVRYLRNDKNLGANRNYKRAAYEARGEYFKWASSNDLVDRNFLAECVAILDARPDVVLCHGTSMLFEEDLSDASEYTQDPQLEMADPVDRFVTLRQQVKLNNILNGVIRRSSLLQTSVMANHYSADNITLAELALRGKIVFTNKTHFYRRMNAESATRLQSDAKIISHHYPEGAGLLARLQTWRLTGSYLKAVVHAPITTRQRVRALGNVAKQTYWDVPSLGRELFGVIWPRKSLRSS